jgi:hypothetical protein
MACAASTGAGPSAVAACLAAAAASTAATWRAGRAVKVGLPTSAAPGCRVTLPVSHEGIAEVDMGPLENFWAIVSLPDNIPIVLMLGLVGYFVRLSFREARKHDKLIAAGHKDQVLKAMQD